VRLILENWRRYLNEGIDPRIQKQIDGLLAFKPGKMGIVIKSNGRFVQTRYARLEGEKMKGEPYGKVDFAKANPNTDGKCFDGWVVSLSGALSGWGPLLYEVALEWTSQNGGGLMADRNVVSGEAAAVWSKYAARSDVATDQMDIAHGLAKSGVKRYGPRKEVPTRAGPTTTRTTSADDIPQLTPDNPDDDCEQNQAIKTAGPEGWMDTPHSKIYKKDTAEVMDTLQKAGLLKVEL
jgi:hypothetical protein